MPDNKSRECLLICHQPRVFVVKLPLARGFISHTNCYLIEDQGEHLLVDTGAPVAGNLRTLEGILDDHGLSAERSSLFVSHAHLDHVGLAEELAGRFSKIYMGGGALDELLARRAAPLSERGLSRALAEGASEDDAADFARGLVGSASERFPEEKVAAVEGGEVIRVGSLSLRVVSTTGHTQGHVSLYDPASGVMIGGDHILAELSPSIDAGLDGRDSLGEYLESLERVREMSPSLLLPGHGDPLHGADALARADLIIRHKLARTEEMLDVVASNPGIGGFGAILLIKWHNPNSTWSRIRPSQRSCMLNDGFSILDHLVATERIDRRVGADGLCGYYAK